MLVLALLATLTLADITKLRQTCWPYTQWLTCYTIAQSFLHEAGPSPCRMLQFQVLSQCTFSKLSPATLLCLPMLASYFAASNAAGHQTCVMPKQALCAAVCVYTQPAFAVAGGSNEQSTLHLMRCCYAEGTSCQAVSSLHRCSPSQVCTLLLFWPVSMRTRCLQVFENRQGLIVASFDAAAAADEGHLAAYMNELVSLNSLTDEWQLSKVATGWALQHAGCTHFMLRPHWVPAVRCVAPQLAGLVPSVQVETP